MEFWRKKSTLLAYKTKCTFYIIEWHVQKLNVVLQQKKLLALEKEMQPQKKVLKERGVRINFSFFQNWVIMNLKCKNCEKEFELFISEFCCKECEEKFYVKWVILPKFDLTNPLRPAPFMDWFRIRRWVLLN